MIMDFNNINLEDYRIKQIEHAYYKSYIDEIDAITTLPKSIKFDLKKSIDLNPLELIKQLTSTNSETIKVLFKTKSGKLIESVLMMHDDGRNTVCVSCMEGCPVGCTFCATGKMGYKGNLEADEIVAQVIYFAKLLKNQYPNRQGISNVVFMGMGEPMLNFNQVWQAYEILTDPNKFGLGKRKTTISTSGFIDGIEKLIQKGYKGRLAISLHAPNQNLREILMSKVAKSNPLDKLLLALDRFSELNNKRITYEYILISNITDTQECAMELARIFRNRLAHINLIPYNSIGVKKYKRPSKQEIQQFNRWLTNEGITSSIRTTMGDDIDAACGQLASQKIK